MSLVSQKLMEVEGSPEAMEQAIRERLLSLTTEADQLEAQVGDTAGEIGHLNAKRTRLGLLWADGDLPDDRWQLERTRLDKQIGEAEQRTANAQADIDEVTRLRRQVRLIKSLSTDLPEVFTWRLGPCDAENAEGDEVCISLDTLAERLDLRVEVESNRLRIEGAISIGAVTLDDKATRGLALSETEHSVSSKSGCADDARPQLRTEGQLESTKKTVRS